MENENAVPLVTQNKLPDEDNIELVPTSVFPDMNYRFKFFNPFQSRFYHRYKEDENVVCSARTGGGKTQIAEMAIYNAVMEKGKRAIFLAPMKSLVKEKYDDWTDPKHAFSEVGISIITGDYRLTDNRKEELNRSKIYILTSEMLDSRSRRMHIEKNEWLLKTDVLVVDEAHIIGMSNKDVEPLEERGHRLEAALMRFSKLNPSCRIVLLSATLPNLPQLGEWLTKLNGKRTEIIVSAYVPQPLEWHLESYPEIKGYGGYYVNKANMFNEAMRVLKSHPNDAWLVFCHSKSDGKVMHKKMLYELEKNVPFHSADLDKEERIEIEKNFKGKKNNMILATSTLAYGVNLPARRVMILDTNRGLSPVHAYDIKQMGGRAGRPGIDPRGDVHWIVGDKSIRGAQYLIDNMPEATSQMFDVDVFAFHIVSEIAERAINTKEGVIEFYNRCLACHQGAAVTEEWLMKLINKLVDIKAIKNENGELKATALGKIASWMYFSPFDIYDWMTNLSHIAEKKINSDSALAWMWAATRSNSMDYVPKDAGDFVEDFRSNWKASGFEDIQMKRCELAAAVIHARIQGKFEDIPASGISMNRALSFDVERHYQAISMIDKMYLQSGKSDGLKMLLTRIKFGVGWNQAKLCILPGIGSVKSAKLVLAGIKSIKDFKEKDEKCIAILGQKTYAKALAGTFDAEELAEHNVFCETEQLEEEIIDHE